LITASGIWCCKQQDTTADIVRLENALEKNFSTAAADSLVALYLQTASEHPQDTSRNLQYLTKAASMQFSKQKNTVGAVRILNDAVKRYAAGNQDMGELFGAMARIWTAYLYKSTPDLSRQPEDIDEMHANLLNNLRWIDSSLYRLDRKMMDNARPGALNLADADAFIEISEAAAALCKEKKQPDDYVRILMQAAGLAKSIGNPKKALQLYYQVESQSPEHRQAPAALFLSGFIYENDLGDLDKAKTVYQDFLKRYPNDPSYLDDVQVSLKNLGKSAEELIREFEKKARTQ
ncbi:MAG: tetratricopeptide repeat protein, partial [Saprospiraceae bacterium]